MLAPTNIVPLVIVVAVNVLLPAVTDPDDNAAPIDIVPDGAVTTSNTNVLLVGVCLTYQAPFGGLDVAAVVPVTYIACPTLRP